MNFNKIKVTTSLISLVLSCFLTHTASALTLIPPPNNVHELVATANIIVTGRIGDIVKLEKFYGYTKNAAKIAQLEKQSFFPLALPLVDYLIEVEEVIMDDVDFPYNGKLIFRTFEEHQRVLSSTAAQERQGHYIFFLTRNPDNQTYGIHSIMHKMKIDSSGKLNYSFRDNTFNPFNKNMTYVDLIEQVKQIIN